MQRNGSNQANIVISGTYTGTPVSIEARWKGGSWQTITATPTGGTFTGTIANQAVGQGTLDVRFTNATSIIQSVPFVGIGDIYIIAGQSNACGRGTSNQSYSHATLKAALFGNDYAWKNLVDPTDSGQLQVDAVSTDLDSTGSYYPLLATSYLANRSYPVAFVPCALSGTRIAEWQPGTDHLDRTTLYGSMYYRFLQVGGAKAVLWWQGEFDALDGATQSYYQTALQALADAVATDMGIPMYITNLQNSTGITDANETVIRNAIAAAIAADPNCKAGADMSDQSSDDNYHLKTTAKLQLVADRTWTILNAAFP